MVSHLVTTKLLTALVIFICGFLSTILPLFVVGKNETLFSAGNMMAAGVLLSAGLVHQLSDSSEGLDESKYPWSFFICGITFIAFLLFEESIHLLLSGSSGHEDDELVRASATSIAHNNSCRGSFQMKTSERWRSSASYGGISSRRDHHDDHHAHLSIAEDEKQELLLHEINQGTDPQAPGESWVSSFRGNPNRTSISGTHHHHEDHLMEHLHGSIVASMMLLMALSVHSVLAGLSIGLVTHTEEILSIALAIVAHKVFAGYALGSTMVAANVDQHLLLSMIFSVSTPLGILIGMRIHFSTEGQAVAIVQAVVAGTFLYVSIMEVGMKELLIVRRDPESPLISLSEKQAEVLKLVSMLVGFMGMSALAAYI